MEKSSHNHIKKILSMLINKILSDLYCIAAFFYTPIELFVKFCRSFRGRLLSSQEYGPRGYSQGPLLKQFLKKQIYGFSALLKDRLLKGTTLFCTFLLQVISFFTTWNGVSYYFSSIHPMAPLAFAFTIQFLFYILSNSNEQKLIFSFTRKLMLACVFFISITFSYIGIMNQYVSPLKTFENRYQSFYQLYQSVYQEVISHTKQNTIPPINKIQLFFENAHALEQLAESELSGYESHINRLSQVSETVRVGRSRWGNTYELNPTYESAQAEQRDYEAKHSQLLTARNRLSQSLEVLEQNTSLEEQLNQYLELPQITAQLMELNNNYKQFLASYRLLLFLLPSASQSDYTNDTTDIPTLDIIQLCDIYLTDMEYNDLELQSLFQIKEALGKDLPSAQSNEYLFQLSSKMEEEITKKYDKLLLAAQKTVPDFHPEALSSLYQNTLPFPDVNLLALEKLRPSSPYFRQGITAFFLALLVDGMTIMIPAFTCSRHNTSLLFKRRHTRLHTEQEVMETILLSLAGYGTVPSESIVSESGIQAAITAFAPLPTSTTRQTIINDSPYRLSQCFHILEKYRMIYASSPWTNGLGYSKYLTVQRLEEENSPVYCHLTDVLCSLGFLRVITEKEYQQLIHKAQGNKALPYPELSSKKTGDTIYLMRKGFDLWLSENLPLYKI